MRRKDKWGDLGIKEKVKRQLLETVLLAIANSVPIWALILVYLILVFSGVIEK